MHELSVCQALMAQVRELAAQRDAGAVGVITLRIGPLSGVEPELLEHAFTIAREGPWTGRATLTIEHVPLIIRCRECGEQGVARPNRMLCPGCESYHVDVVSGDELLLARVELLDARPATSAEPTV
ncbi:MAG: hydrogenase maturation nickel metallochaperone HypA [Wenzhouxiangellaceae bacterium]|nr:hydrogenase maturation nickel metallochaperone HypA [Wenzhouxiangellaceae bacterium]